MAQLYHVSADMSEKEKIIGGVLTLAQGLWLTAGFLVFGALFMLFQSFLPKAFAVVFALIPGLALGLPFAFYKKEDLPLFTYLKLKREFEQKTKTMINDLHYGKNVKGE